MRTIGINRRGRSDSPHVNEIHPPRSLHALLPRADALVVTLPLTDETRGMLDAQALDRMKPRSILVSAGRGGVIDEPALVRALREQRLAGAALEVFATEPLPADSPLWDLPNVLISPHTAALSVRESASSGCSPRTCAATSRARRCSAASIQRSSIDAGATVDSRRARRPWWSLVRVACGFDHAGVPLRDAVLSGLRDGGHHALDLGDADDFPLIARGVAAAVVDEQADRGVLVCGSGAGVAVAATKVRGIRAATVSDCYTVWGAKIRVLPANRRFLGALTEFWHTKRSRPRGAR